MSTWESLVLRVWREADGVRGRVVRIGGPQAAAFSSAQEAGRIVERLVAEIADAPAQDGGADVPGEVT